MLCGGCSKQHLRPVPSRCFRCRKINPGWRVCAACRRTSALSSVRVSVTYEGYAQSLIWYLKFEGAQAVARELARFMAPNAAQARPDTAIVPLPTASSRVRRRGYDQAKLLAKEISRQTGLPLLDALKRYGQAHQVGASRQQRLRQLNAAFTVRGRMSLMAERVILVDDVTTTGASLEAAAAALKRAGAKHIEAVVFAQP